MQYVPVTGTKQITGTRGVLKGFSINCTVTGVLKIRDGAAGTTVVTLNMANGTDKIESFGNGIPFNNRINVEVVSGTFDGTVWVE